MRKITLETFAFPTKMKEPFVLLYMRAYVKIMVSFFLFCFNAKNPANIRLCFAVEGAFLNVALVIFLGECMITICIFFCINRIHVYK